MGKVVIDMRISTFCSVAYDGGSTRSPTASSWSRSGVSHHPGVTHIEYRVVR